MLFTSFNFLCFLLFTLSVVHLFFYKGTQKKLLILVASYFFYMSWDWRFGLLLFFISISNFVLGYYIHRAEKLFMKRLFLILSLSFSLGALAYFKYVNFFIESLSSLFQFFGVENNLEILDIVLPVGISFYTFQSLSYTLDIYLEKEEPIDSPLDFLVFVSFFPQLVAGPIVRARFFLPQLTKDRGYVEKSEFETGIFLIIVGLIKKVAFADVLATHIVDPAFEDPSQFSSLYLVIALYAYSFQIYMDFSAYTDIARGIAKMFGYELPINFNRPYLATSVTNFWQRWHISMSSFFRDYLYFGLGGAKRGNVYFNLMITFVAIGMWHGAGWNFLVYGAVHGSLMCIERYRRKKRERLGLGPKKQTKLGLTFTIFYIFTIISLARLLFRAPDLSEAKVFFSRLIELSTSIADLSVIGACALLGASLLHFIPKLNKDLIHSYWVRMPALVQGGFITIIVYVLIAFSQGSAPFVYFQF